MNMKIWTKWQISVLGDIYILLPFYLILTRGPIIIVKKNSRVILSWRMLLKMAFRCTVCSIRVLTKNHGDPYYEPTIMVHDKENSTVNRDYSYKKKGNKGGRPHLQVFYWAFNPYSQDEVMPSIIFAGIGDHPCILTFYNHDPYWLWNY